MSMKAEARRCTDHFKSEYSDTMCRIGEVLLAFSGGILTLITFGTAYWLQAKSTDQVALVYHSGLWQKCIVSDGHGCSRLPISGPAYLLASRFFMSLALISCILSAILSILGMLQHKYKWLFAATGTYAVQAISSLIGLASFSPGFKPSTSEPNQTLSGGWSYSVGWISMVAAILCAVYFGIVGICRFKNPAPHRAQAESRAYAPLAQLESTDTDDDYDDDL